MTREEILAKPAGRELDTLVAEKVMGFHIDRFTAHYDGLYEQCQVWIDAEGKSHNPRKLSTDISAAWEVVEELRKRYFHIEIMTDEKHWKVRTNSDEWVFALDAAESICKAALLAVMEQQ
jgi:hypothetical protein